MNGGWRDSATFPRLQAGRTVLAPDALTYNPCDDLIFPSVVRASEYLRHPLGRYYLYYAPHDAPGGICLAYADTVDGPWHEHPSNPLVTRAWVPHYEVERVSSPHAMWRSDREELWLYYHGDNETTRWAPSRDGVAVEYGGEVVHAASLGMDGPSSARVFASPFRHGRAPYVSGATGCGRIAVERPHLHLSSGPVAPSRRSPQLHSAR